jgi:hypothetical protein
MRNVSGTQRSSPAVARSRQDFLARTGKVKFANFIKIVSLFSPTLLEGPCKILAWATHRIDYKWWLSEKYANHQLWSFVTYHPARSSTIFDLDFVFFVKADI